jgi:PKD repeat protein
MRRAVTALPVLLLVLVAASAGTASADTFCVNFNPPTGCVGTPKTSIAGAIDAANLTTGRDRIEIASGTYTPQVATSPNLSVTAGNPVDIVGVGPTQPVIAPSATETGATVFGINEPSSTLSNVAIEIPDGMNFGLSLVGNGTQGPRADSVSVTLESGADDPGLSGVNVSAGAVLSHSLIDLSLVPAQLGITGHFAVEASPGSIVEDSKLSGGTVAYDAFGLGAPMILRRSVLAQANSVLTAGPGDTQADDDLFEGQISLGAGTGAGILSIHNGTILADESPGVSVSATGGAHATLDLRSSIIRGTAAHELSADTAGSGSTAAVDVDYSDYRFGTEALNGTGTSIAEHGRANSLNDVDPRFVLGAGGYGLKAGSPAIDRGDPAGLVTGESAMDVAGAPRITDGDGDCTMRRDMGAYEFQPAAPVARATAMPGSALTGVPVSFDGSGSCATVPGDTLTGFAWSADDGATGTGSIFSHAFATSGTHAGTLTVTDSRGRTATASASAAISDPIPPAPNPLPPPLTPPPLTKPVLSSLHTTHVTFAPGKSSTPLTGTASAKAKPKPKPKPAPKGATFSFRLDKAATVSIEVLRATTGRKVGKSCLTSTKSRAKDPKCTRYVHVRTFTRTGHTGTNKVLFNARFAGHNLPAGTYHAVFTASNQAGKAKALTLLFHVVAK